MNKRQYKKRVKTISDRLGFFNNRIKSGGRKNGKTSLQIAILKVALSKKYKPFKELQRRLNDYCISINHSNGKLIRSE